MRVIHNAKNPSTETELFGKKMSLPIFAAPITATTLNMGGIVSEEEMISKIKLNTRHLVKRQYT